jgi:TonB family protein
MPSQVVQLVMHPPDIGSRYERLDCLREGGMGAVFRVRDRRLDRILVAKTILLPEHAGPQEQKERQERFRREAELASRLTHPNIVQIHDLIPEGPWIIMEFVEGPTLRDLLDERALSLGLTLEIARQALRALSYLHAKGAIHRDISPDNLMLTRDAEGAPLVKLIDLGIARSVSDDGQLTGKGGFIGKLRYASPEHLEDMEPLAVASDIFSFGVVLYELLTGLHPFAGRSSSRGRGRSHPAPLAFAVSDPGGRIPADLRAIVARALEDDPRRRFGSAEELAARLAAVQSRFPWKAGEVTAVLGALPLRPATGAAAAKVGHGSRGEITRPSLDRIPLVHQATQPPQRRKPAPSEVPSTPGSAPGSSPGVVRRRTLSEAGHALPSSDATSPAMIQSLAATVLGLLLLWPFYQLLQSVPRRPYAPTTVTAAIGRNAGAERPHPRPLSHLPPAPPPGEGGKAVVGSESAQPSSIVSVVDAAAESPPQAEPALAVLKEREEPAQPVRQIRKAHSVAPPGRSRSVTVGGEDFFETEPAVALSVPRPEPPRVDHGAEARAEIVIGFWVDRTGAVSDARVELSHVDGRVPAFAFEAAALDAARQARFRPARRKGTPVDSWNTLTYTFRVTD